MTDRRRVIMVVLAGILFCATARADMTSVSRPEIGCGKVPQVRGPGDLPDRNPLSPFDSTDGTDLDSLSGELLSKAIAHADPACETPAVQVFAQEPRSLDLCLYALMGLGLCKSAPWVKRLSFSHIPEWYHSAGPYQIGHSFAISPDCLCSTSVCCFVQPDDVAEARMPLHRQETVVCLWRESQFTSDVIAPRGPPTPSEASLVA